MAAYRRVYDSRHCRLTAKNRDQLLDPTLGNRVWATFYLFLPLTLTTGQMSAIFWRGASVLGSHVRGGEIFGRGWYKIHWLFAAPADVLPFELLDVSEPNKKSRCTFEHHWRRHGHAWFRQSAANLLLICWKQPTSDLFQACRLLV